MTRRDAVRHEPPDLILTSALFTDHQRILHNNSYCCTFVFVQVIYSVETNLAEDDTGCAKKILLLFRKCL